MLLETKKSIWIGGRAHLLDASDRDSAWAERALQTNPSLKWVLGRYVEADKANNNMQKWSLDTLKDSKDTIKNTPMNFLHQAKRIVGHYVDVEMMYPEMAEDSAQPYVDALGAVYAYYFPEEFDVIERAHKEGTLYFSMEQVARSVTCEGCSREFAYKGPSDISYCSHINNRESARIFNDSIFLGGALIVPPVKPGWTGASIKDISQIIVEYAEDELYQGVQEDMPGQDPKVWEAMMAQILDLVTASEGKL